MSDDALELVQRAIAATDAIDVNVKQDFPGLAKVKAELAAMLSAIEGQSLPDRQHRNVGLSRLVTDSWPLDAKATVAVIEAEKGYEEA